MFCGTGHVEYAGSFSELCIEPGLAAAFDEKEGPRMSQELGEANKEADTAAKDRDDARDEKIDEARTAQDRRALGHREDGTQICAQAGQTRATL